MVISQPGYKNQHQDYRNAITWVSLQKEVDPQRIGIWGSSLSGGHVLHLAAFDRRVKAVVAQVPGTDTWETFFQAMKPEELAGRSAWLAQNRIDEYTKDKVNYFPVVAPEGQPCVLPQKEAYVWFTETAKLRAPNWKIRLQWNRLKLMQSTHQRSTFI